MNICKSCSHLEVRGKITCETSKESEIPSGTHDNVFCYYSQSCMNNVTVKSCPRYQKDNESAFNKLKKDE